MLSFLKKQEKGWVGVDIGTSSVKMVALSKRGDDLRVDAYAISPLPATAVIDNSIQDVGLVSEVIERGLKICNKPLQQAVTAVPSSAVISKTIELSDSFTEFDLEEQVKIEADRFIPYPLDEVALDFEVLGPSPSNAGLNEVLLVACRSNDVEKREDAINGADLNCQVVDVDSFCIERVYPLLVLDGADDQALVGLVDIGAATLTLNVFRNNQIVYNREQAFGGNDLNHLLQQQTGLVPADIEHQLRNGELSDELMETVVLPFRSTISQQISRALQFFYSSGAHNQLTKLCLQGGGVTIDGLADIVAEEVGVPTELANPFAGMDVDSKINPARLAYDAPSLVKACGMSLRSFEH
ncbi:type IV pilus assembly protein PilM [Aliamphritea hakodatensis]|uniref:type IV pilus assembly protein PilM n=1 Tax=Aliamphritea hakodatensis TaxID=2895352 RepID=UPI0022FD8B39|nr:type IV pilus assembly protein PilM [Aliamphritea hakodatensis]